MIRKVTPNSSVVWLGKEALIASHRKVKGITPTTGPQSRPVPPRSAMITTWKESIGVTANDGSMQI